jgi:predicted ATPase
MALRAYLQAWRPRAGLPVLIVEDLHWADDSSLDLLQHLLAHAAELPLALVMTARPPLLTAPARLGQPQLSRRHRVALMTLARGADQSNELLQALLQRLGEVPPR